MYNVIACKKKVTLPICTLDVNADGKNIKLDHRKTGCYQIVRNRTSQNGLSKTQCLIFELHRSM